MKQKRQLKSSNLGGEQYKGYILPIVLIFGMLFSLMAIEAIRWSTHLKGNFFGQYTAVSPKETVQ